MRSALITKVLGLTLALGMQFSALAQTPYSGYIKVKASYSISSADPVINPSGTPTTKAAKTIKVNLRMGMEPGHITLDQFSMGGDMIPGMGAIDMSSGKAVFDTRTGMMTMGMEMPGGAGQKGLTMDMKYMVLKLATTNPQLQQAMAKFAAATSISPEKVKDSISRLLESGDLTVKQGKSLVINGEQCKSLVVSGKHYSSEYFYAPSVTLKLNELMYSALGDFAVKIKDFYKPYQEAWASVLPKDLADLLANGAPVRVVTFVNNMAGLQEESGSDLDVSMLPQQISLVMDMEYQVAPSLDPTLFDFSAYDMMNITNEMIDQNLGNSDTRRRENIDIDDTGEGMDVYEEEEILKAPIPRKPAPAPAPKKKASSTKIKTR